MGVLYEHWRPDLNECFYVGISWGQEETRPYDFSKRNKKHQNIIKFLKEKGLKAEVKIQAWDLTKEELYELEVMQIAYWRDLIGDRLTNIADGGQSGPSFPGELNSMKKIQVIEKQKKNVPRGKDHYTRDFDFVHYAKKENFVHWINKKTEEEKKIFVNKSVCAAQNWWKNASQEELLEVKKARSNGVKNWWKNMPEEKKNEIAKKIQDSRMKYSPEERSNFSRIGHLKRTFEERSKSARDGQLKRSQEERKESARKAIEKQSKNQLSERAKKGHETRRRNKELKFAAQQAAKDMEN